MLELLQKEDIEDTAAQVLKRPYKASYYLPGRLEGRPVQFLMNTEWATNLLLKKVFDKLLVRVMKLREESAFYGLLADGCDSPSTV